MAHLPHNEVALPHVEVLLPHVEVDLPHEEVNGKQKKPFVFSDLRLILRPYNQLLTSFITSSLTG